MLINLDADHSDFNEQFNKIIFGTMLIALVIETKKYGIKLYSHVNKDNFDVVTLRSLRDPSMKLFIEDIGAKVLANKLPFDIEYVDRHFSTLAKNVPSIKQRLKTNALNAIDATDHENQNSWRWCNIL
jgi:predicted nucleotidyltransferase